MVRHSTKQRRRTLFEDALGAIARDFGDENLSLAAVAHSIATSRRQLQRVRMSHAAELLSAGTVPVASVARAVGYRQAAQFSKAFRRHHGHPPSAARPARREQGSAIAA